MNELISIPDVDGEPPSIIRYFSTKCDCVEKRMTKKAIKDGRVAYYMQCMRCGRNGQAVKKSIAERGIVFDFNYTLYDDFKKKQWDRYLDFSKLYSEYLLSKEWRDKRVQAFRFFGKNCLVCGGSATTIHHKTYKRIFRELVEEDLMPVCEECHAKIHAA